MKTPLHAISPALAAAFLGLTLAPVVASAAPPMQRPTRVTDDFVSTTTHKILVAVPTDRLGDYRYLYVVTPGSSTAHGIPISLDGATPRNSTLVMMNAPLLHARDGFLGRDHLRPQQGGFDMFALGSAAPMGNRDLGEAVAELRSSLRKPLSVFATTGPRLTELPEHLQTDPWALLNAGRYHDAGAVFATAPAGPEREIGMALAAALLGRIDAAEPRLAKIQPAELPGGLPIHAALQEKIQALAEVFYAETDAGRTLLALADASASMLDQNATK